MHCAVLDPEQLYWRHTSKPELPNEKRKTSAKNQSRSFFEGSEGCDRLGDSAKSWGMKNLKMMGQPRLVNSGPLKALERLETMLKPLEPSNPSTTMVTCQRNKSTRPESQNEPKNPKKTLPQMLKHTNQTRALQFGDHQQTFSNTFPEQARHHTKPFLQQTSTCGCSTLKATNGENKTFASKAKDKVACYKTKRHCSLFPKTSNKPTAVLTYSHLLLSLTALTRKGDPKRPDRNDARNDVGDLLQGHQLHGPRQTHGVVEHRQEDDVGNAQLSGRAAGWCLVRWLGACQGFVVVWKGLVVFFFGGGMV